MHLVDIPICAYNHDQYIAQCLDGILAQKVNFEYRILIANDCSTDKTKEVIDDYVKEHPNVIFAFHHEQNMGASANSEFILAKCSAPYLATCDSDDLWVNENKLQKQVDLLIANPHASFCFTKVELKFETEIERHRYQDMGAYPKLITLADYLDHYYPIPMLTKVFRTSNIKSYGKEEWSLLGKSRFGDNVLHMLDLIKGPAIFLNEITGTYRVQSQSMTRTAPEDSPWHIEEILRSHHHFAGLTSGAIREKFIAIRLFHYEKLLDFYMAKKKPFQVLSVIFRLLIDTRTGNFRKKSDSVIKVFKRHIKN